MGGTFDPIHYGHLFAAEESLEALGLDKVIFVPSGTPPHKAYSGMATAEQRFAMTAAAISENERFYISRLETDRPGMSYTLDTLEAMREIYPGAGLFFITGMDAVIDILNWRAPLEISRMCTITVLGRPGYEHDTLGDLPESIRDSLRFVEAPMLDISATDIRRRVREGRSARYLLPEAVCDFICVNDLYSSRGGDFD
jgi:nicotinate-nucleotide adenylyltransferase